jgi:hypothetical protein
MRRREDMEEREQPAFDAVPTRGRRPRRGHVTTYIFVAVGPSLEEMMTAFRIISSASYVPFNHVHNPVSLRFLDPRWLPCQSKCVCVRNIAYPDVGLSRVPSLLAVDSIQLALPFDVRKICLFTTEKVLTRVSRYRCVFYITPLICLFFWRRAITEVLTTCATSLFPSTTTRFFNLTPMRLLTFLHLRSAQRTFLQSCY